MRKPVRSTVANRKYFQGGGLAPMKPAAPEEAVGIMASSQPLVDIIAQSAGNPQGGMSPLNFADGGLAKFQLGGVGNVPTPQNVPKSRLRRLGDLAMNLNPFRTFQSINPLRVTLDKKTGPALMGIGRFLTDVPTDARLKNLSIDQLSTIEFQKNENPGRENDVEQAGRIAVTKNPSISPKELSLEINKLIKRAEPRELTSEEIERNKTSIDPITDKQREQSKKSIKEAEAQRIEEITKGIEGKDASDKDIKTEEFTFPFAKQEKTSVVKKSEDAETIDNVENITGSEEKKDPTQDPVKQGEESKTAMDETIQNINKNAEEGNQEETTKSIEDYTEEFKKAMPKFEGMTEEEKGMAILEAGLAIMGGQSPRALENISNGLSNLVKKFTKNKEQERAFNQQVNIAAAKYGISKVDQDRQRELALSDQLAKEGRTYAPGRVVLKPFTYKGKKYGKNDFFEFTRSEMETEEFKNIPAGTLASESAFGQIEQSKRQFSINQANIDKAYAELKEKQLGKGIKYSNYDDNMQEYQSAGQDFYRGLRMRAQLGEAAKLLEISLIDAKKEGGLADELLGAKGYFGDKFNKAMNLAGVDRNRLTKLRSTRPAQFNAIMKNIGTQMLVEILNESTKTVSDNDRIRVEELTATLTDFSAFAKDPEVIRRQLLNLDASIKAGVVKNSTTMSRLESTFDKGLKVSGVPLSTLDPKKELLKIKEGLTTGLTGVKDTSGEVIKVSDIWDPTADDGAGNFKQLDLNI